MRLRFLKLPIAAIAKPPELVGVRYAGKADLESPLSDAWLSLPHRAHACVVQTVWHPLLFFELHACGIEWYDLDIHHPVPVTRIQCVDVLERDPLGVGLHDERRQPSGRFVP